jgi:DtxR family transcriptional regulator, Mn-dependent transcriptional regulator
LQSAPLVTAPPLSHAAEDYLKEIFHLLETGANATTAALAHRLSVAPPSVTSMVKRLQEMGLVTHSPYREIELTQAGRAVAVEIVRHHRLLELYLTKYLDVPWDQVHEEAERLEHVISEDLESRMAEKLGQPGYDPHGDPIPSDAGEFPGSETFSLWALDQGDQATVARVADQRQDVLAYLSGLRVAPGSKVRVIEKSALAGTLTLRVDGDSHVIGAELAKSIFVAKGSA